MNDRESTQLRSLTTEARNAASEHLDTMSTLEMLGVMNDEDAKVAAAVRAVLPEIARAVDAIAERFRRGGRLFYVGAGTSGRLGVLDASECPPTFSVSADLVQGLIAGGDRALRLSSEHSEDSREEGAEDLRAAGFGRAYGFGRAAGFAQNANPNTPVDPDTPVDRDTPVDPDAPVDPHRPVDPDALVGPDTLVGIAASGRTPYVLGAMEWARSEGALVIGLSCVEGSEVAQAADIAITPVTGPEVLTGSTRMKAGTATKLVLNMLSTGVMVRSGATYGNLMVNVRATNRKLVNRAERIVAAVSGCSAQMAATTLRDAGMDVKTAIVMVKLGVSREQAATELAAAGGALRRVIG